MVLAIEKFADYSSDRLISPIQEICGQLIGILARYLNNDYSQKMYKLLKFLEGEATDWQGRYGAWVGLKHCFLAHFSPENRSNNHIFKLTDLLELLLDRIQDEEDCIRNTVTSLLLKLFPQMVEEIFQSHPSPQIKFQESLISLWEALIQVEPSSFEMSDLLDLICKYHFLCC